MENYNETNARDKSSKKEKRNDFSPEYEYLPKLQRVVAANPSKTFVFFHLKFPRIKHFPTVQFPDRGLC